MFSSLKKITRRCNWNREQKSSWSVRRDRRKKISIVENALMKLTEGGEIVLLQTSAWCNGAQLAKMTGRISRQSRNVIEREFSRCGEKFRNCIEFSEAETLRFWIPFGNQHFSRCSSAARDEKYKNTRICRGHDALKPRFRPMCPTARAAVKFYRLHWLFPRENMPQEYARKDIGITCDFYRVSYVKSVGSTNVSGLFIFFSVCATFYSPRNIDFI